MGNSFNAKFLLEPGEHKLLLDGKVGKLESILRVPQDASKKYLAILGHPHSLYGGTMQNKVVTTMAKAFNNLGITSLRCNFRGVGLSEGTYDEGLGESEDLLMLANQYPDYELIFAGFSFGSYVTYKASIHKNTKLLISIAPAVTHFDYTSITPATKNWIILQGDMDEVIPYEAVYGFAKEHNLEFIKFSNTSHFFHGQLTNLQEQLTNLLISKLHLC